MYLIKFKDNYADEFNVHGFYLMEPDKWVMYEKVIRELWSNSLTEIMFGSNEWLTFESADDFFGSHEVVEITTKEVEFLEKHFICKYSKVYGTVPEPDIMLEYTQCSQEVYDEIIGPFE